MAVVVEALLLVTVESLMLEVQLGVGDVILLPALVTGMAVTARLLYFKAFIVEKGKRRCG